MLDVWTNEDLDAKMTSVNMKLTKQAYSIKNEIKKLNNEIRWEMYKSMKWSWFKVPLKVEQLNEFFFSDTVQSQKK